MTSTGTAQLSAPWIGFKYSTDTAHLVSASVAGGNCSQEAVCTLADLRPDERGEVAIVLKAIAQGTIRLDLRGHAAYAPAPGLPSFTVTRTAGASIAATPDVADLSVKLATSTARPSVGAVARLVATVSNAGGGDPPSAAVGLTLPAGLRLAGISSAQGTCTRTPLRCAFGSLAAHATVRVTVSVAATRIGVRKLVARISGGASVDPNGADNVGKLVPRADPPRAKRRP
jgi:hypothetical protein